MLVEVVVHLEASHLLAQVVKVVVVVAHKARKLRVKTELQTQVEAAEAVETLIHETAETVVQA
jgi:hypothetical protein